MIGFRLLAKIDARLLQATGRKQSVFGGLSVALVEDIKQLPPVLDRAI
jgi:hypothetical protein